jgi:Outer membrane efflux protein
MSWLNADGLNPLAVGLRLARNLAGGGDRAAARLEIAQMERRRAEVEAGLRLAVAERVAELEAAGRRLSLAREREATHRSRLALLVVGYRLGEGSTEEMITLLQAGEELRVRVAEAAAELARGGTRLRALIFAWPAQVW